MGQEFREYDDKCLIVHSKRSRPQIGSRARIYGRLRTVSAVATALAVTVSIGCLLGVGEAAASSSAASSPQPTASVGLDVAQANGMVTPLGGAGYYGSLYGRPLPSPIVALLPTPDRGGYWLISADGSVHAFGDAANAGSAVGQR